jgi:hypothetical protein
MTPARRRERPGHARPPYHERPGRDTTNDTDVIFPTGGEPTVLQLRTSTDGYLGAVRLHLPVLA